MDTSPLQPFRLTKSGRVIENLACRYVEPGTYGRLLRLDDEGFGQCWPLNGVECIGRSAACEIALEDLSVSRQHATIRPRHDMAGGLMVEDLRSANGVRVEGRLVEQPTLIRPGMRLHFGDVEMVMFRELPFHRDLCKVLRPRLDEVTGFELPTRATPQIACVAERMPVTAIITRPGNSAIDIDRLARAMVKITRRAFGTPLVYVRLGDNNLMGVLFSAPYDHELETCLENLRWSPELPYVTAFRFGAGEATTDWPRLLRDVHRRSRDAVEIVDFRAGTLRPGNFADWTAPTALLGHIRKRSHDFDRVLALRPWRAHYFRKRLGLAGAVRAIDGLRRVVRRSLGSRTLMASRDDRVFIASGRAAAPAHVTVAHIIDAWRDEMSMGWLSLEYAVVDAALVARLAPEEALKSFSFKEEHQMSITHIEDVKKARSQMETYEAKLTDLRELDQQLYPFVEVSIARRFERCCGRIIDWLSGFTTGGERERIERFRRGLEHSPRPAMEREELARWIAGELSFSAALEHRLEEQVGPLFEDGMLRDWLLEGLKDVFREGREMVSLVRVDGLFDDIETRLRAADVVTARPEFPEVEEVEKVCARARVVLRTHDPDLIEALHEQVASFEEFAESAEQLVHLSAAIVGVRADLSVLESLLLQSNSTTTYWCDDLAASAARRRYESLQSSLFEAHQFAEAFLHDFSLVEHFAGSPIEVDPDLIAEFALWQRSV